MDLIILFISYVVIFFDMKIELGWLSFNLK
jgi:hypothetical protein